MEIYVAKSDQQTGPFSEQQIESMLNSGMIVMSDLAWHAGLSDWVPLHQVLKVNTPMTLPARPPLLSASVRGNTSASQTATNAGAMFLYIPTSRLIVMSILSLGLYDAYWIYRNWRFLKERDGLSIQPFWRGVFGLFHITSLLKMIKNDPSANSLAEARFSPGWLASGWILLMFIGNTLGRSADPTANLIGIIISAPAFLCLLPVQNYINSVNESLPRRPAYYGWTGGQLLCLVLGVIFWILFLAGMAG